VGIFFIDLLLKIPMWDFVEYLCQLYAIQNLMPLQVELQAPKLKPLSISTTFGPSSDTFNFTSKNNFTLYLTIYLATLDLSCKL